MWHPLLERVRRYAPGAQSEICETIVTIIQSASFARGVQQGPGGLGDFNT